MWWWAGGLPGGADSRSAEGSTKERGEGAEVKWTSKQRDERHGGDRDPSVAVEAEQAPSQQSDACNGSDQPPCGRSEKTKN